MPMLFATFLVLLIAGFSSRALAVPQPHAIMPAPAEFHVESGQLAISRGFTFRSDGFTNARLNSAIDRAAKRLVERTGIPLGFMITGQELGGLAIICDGPGNALPTLHEDESYTLDVTPVGATLRAPAVVGVLRGLETLLQLLASDANGFHLPIVSVRDAPRFPWRGLLIDVCRHWQPLPVIKRTLDGMALVKLNVLHLHLTEDQGFRIESKTHPRLHELGSDGNFFTQDEIREIIDYATARGIRVVPEFDIPGHATSWLVGCPEIASQPGPYAIERKWGVFDPTLDPTNEQTYELLEDFLGEMAALFPDPYLHIGGDENNGRQWAANPRIQAFVREHGLKDNHGLQAYFNRRVLAILTQHGKRMIGWDEIFHPDLPNNVVIHSWRGRESLAATARQGYDGILSSGYYIDLCHPARDHYLNDPLPADTTLAPGEQAHILGGEATMWTEWVTPETIDSRIWPRTAAIAERLWSSREVSDVDDMYRRLAVVSFRLEEIGLSLTRHVDFMLQRFAGDDATAEDLAALRVIADLVEPVKGYERGRQQPDTTQSSPLTTFADCARPDSASARTFATLITRAVASRNADDVELVRRTLLAWTGAAATVRAHPTERTALLDPLLQRLVAACDIGQQACDQMVVRRPTTAEWRRDRLAALDAAAQPHDACELPIIAPLRQLVETSAPATP